MKSDWVSLIFLAVKCAVALGAGCFLLTFILLWKNIQPLRSPFLPLEKASLPTEEVTFQTSDGLHLKGSLSLLDPVRPTILLCHGVGANRRDLSPFAQLLYEKGRMNVFLFDFRAHGESEGRLTSYGAYEQRDLEAALAFLDQRVPRKEYGFMGISMGGSVGILVASHDKRLKALWVDSPYINLAETMEAYMRLLYHLPRFPFGPFTLNSYWLLFRTSAWEISPINAVERLAPRPLMIVNGLADERIPPALAQRLYEKAKEPKSLWLIPGAGHLEGHQVNPTEYDERLLSFFKKALSENSF